VVGGGPDHPSPPWFWCWRPDPPLYKLPYYRRFVPDSGSRGWSGPPPYPTSWRGVWTHPPPPPPSRSAMLAHTGKGKNLPGKTHVGKNLSRISGQNFSSFFQRIGAEFSPANLRIVEFNYTKTSITGKKYYHKFPAFRAGQYIFYTLHLYGTVILPRRNKDWDIFFLAEFSRMEFFSPR
jgi:hypothetical protein